MKQHVTMHEQQGFFILIWEAITLTDQNIFFFSFETDTYKKGGVPSGFEPLMPTRTSNPWSPIARHTCDTAQPAFPNPYRLIIDDVVGLGTIFFML